MIEKIEIPYSKSFGFTLVSFVSVAFFYVTKAIVTIPKLYETNYYGWLVGLLFDLLLLLVLILSIKDYFLPCLKKTCAIELNQFGIIDHTQGYTFYWKDVYDIQYVKRRGRGSENAIKILLRDHFEFAQSKRTFLFVLNSSNYDFQFEKTFMIYPLAASGNDEDVFDTIFSYFNKVKR